MQWFRLHNKLLNDPSVQGLSGDHFKIYINILCYASSIDRGGYIGTLHETAFALRETLSTVTSCFNVLQGVGLIVTNETDGETFQIPQWKKKQYESDSSTERVKRHREKVKRSKTVTVTAPDTDTDTEQIQSKTIDQSALDRPSVLKEFVATSAHFDMFWDSGIRKVNKKKAKSLFNNLLKKESNPENFTMSLCEDVTRRLDSNQLGFAEMHPTTYLNGERWNDEVIPNAENKPNQNAGGHRLSTVDRVRATNEANRAARADSRDNLGDANGYLRQHTGQPIRGSDAGSLDGVIEGDYTESN